MLSDLLVDLPGLRLLQFVQDSLFRLDVNVVTTADLSAELEQKMINEVKELVGSEMTIVINRVPDIARNPRSGKYREVICNIRPPVAATQPQV
jgi:hypothetical protein